MGPLLRATAHHSVVVGARREPAVTPVCPERQPCTSAAWRGGTVGKMPPQKRRAGHHGLLSALGSSERSALAKTSISRSWTHRAGAAGPPYGTSTALKHRACRPHGRGALLLPLKALNVAAATTAGALAYGKSPERQPCTPAVWRGVIVGEVPTGSVGQDSAVPRLSRAAVMYLPRRPPAAATSPAVAARDRHTVMFYHTIETHLTIQSTLDRNTLSTTAHHFDSYKYRIFNVRIEKS